MSEAREHLKKPTTEKDSPLTTVARSLGGSAALGLLGAVAGSIATIPAEATVTVGALVGLIGGYFIKNLDKN